ncbi:MAG: hypothetical protein HUN05_02010 [Desulfobacter sp.]|nr:MAG: hypothetical protein HUN05_02010 [Desulfobacter sp.]
MKAIQAKYVKEPFEIKVEKNAVEEDWPEVCSKFNDDVERVCDVGDIPGYTGLYQCFDEMNQKTYYLVNEDKSLFRLRRQHFLDNIGYRE